MSDVSSLVDSLGKEYFDSKLERTDLGCADGRFPSYFRSLRNFFESLPGANQDRPVRAPGQATTHFPSTIAHVAIV
jgi:hypothetical protein